MAIKQWDGDNWAEVRSVKYWDGDSWVSKIVKHWDGDSWVDLSTYVYTFDCVESNSLCPENWPSSKWTNDAEVRQGVYGSPDGNHMGFIWFNTTDIMAKLEGRRIAKVEAYLYRKATGVGGVVPVHIWGHNMPQSLAGSTSVGTLAEGETYLIHESADVQDMARSTGYWITILNDVGEHLRDGTAKGIALYVGTSAGEDDYLDVEGYSETSPPQLRITCY